MEQYFTNKNHKAQHQEPQKIFGTLAP